MVEFAGHDALGEGLPLLHGGGHHRGWVAGLTEVDELPGAERDLDPGPGALRALGGGAGPGEVGRGASATVVGFLDGADEGGPGGGLARSIAPVGSLLSVRATVPGRRRCVCRPRPARSRTTSASRVWSSCVPSQFRAMAWMRSRDLLRRQGDGVDVGSSSSRYWLQLGLGVDEHRAVGLVEAGRCRAAVPDPARSRSTGRTRVGTRGERDHPEAHVRALALREQVLKLVRGRHSVPPNCMRRAASWMTGAVRRGVIAV